MYLIFRNFNLLTFQGGYNIICVVTFKAFGKEENFKFCLWDGGHTISDDDEGFDFIKSAY